jgi:acetyltransferase-like isoleucine patch superfamily enzyme
VSLPVSLARKAFWAAKDREGDARRAVSAVRREALIARLRAQAAWKRSTVDIDIAPDAQFGPDVRVILDPNCDAQLAIGPEAILEGHCRINLRGGSVTLGARSVLREGVVLNVPGVLHVGERAALSYGTSVHCANRVSIGELAAIAEYVTIADSTHFLTEPDVKQSDNVRTRPVSIGRNTWICPKATVTCGVAIGDYSVIGSGVTVTRNVPESSLVVQGQVNQITRRLPWNRTERVPA